MALGLPPVDGATEGYHHFDRPNARFCGRTAALLRRAVVEMLVRNEERSGVPWTHVLDQSFNTDGPRTPEAIRKRYGAALGALPSLLAPTVAWMVIEPHPHGSGFHMHGVWKAGAATLVPQWWRAVKEWMWSNLGSARLWPLGGAPTVAGRAAAVAYMLKHAVKGSPTTFLQKSTRYTRQRYANGTVVVRWSRDHKPDEGWWVATRDASGVVTVEREV